MKTPFTLLLLLIGSVQSCRTLQERRYHTQQEQVATVAKQHQQYRYAQQYRDSSMQYWLFASDSLFYFHPKDGLWSTGGSLLFGHESIAQQQQTHSYALTDSTFTHVSSMTDTLTAVRKDKPKWKRWVLILILGIGGLYGSYLFIGRRLKP